MCFRIFQNDLRYFNVLQDIWHILRYFEVFFKYFKVLLDILTYLEILQGYKNISSTSRYVRIFYSNLEFFKGILRYFIVFQNISKYFRIF